jgi:tetratricopeptide (TPR) repeat protein
MVQSFSSDWLRLLKDPYAVVGVSVSADAQRITKRYRRVAKLLHPDRYAATNQADGALAEGLFAKLVNPAYRAIETDQSRAETKARLRLQARQQHRQAPLQPQGNLACQLMQLAPTEIDVFYEQAIDQLAATQYQPLSNFAIVTEQLIELNLLYSQLKQGDLFMREKRTGMVPVDKIPPGPVSIFPHDPSAAKVDYAQRHFERAKEYAKKELWEDMVRELQDALKLESKKSEYHSLMGYARLKQNNLVIAKICFRTALKLNPQDAWALKFAPQVGLDRADPPPARSTTASNGAKSNGRSPQATQPPVSQRSPYRPAPTTPPRSPNRRSQPLLIGAVIAGVGSILLGLVVWKYGHLAKSKPTSRVPLESTLQRSRSLAHLGRWGVDPSQPPFVNSEML